MPVQLHKRGLGRAFLVVRIGRMLRRRRRRVLLQEFHHHLDGLFQLRIVARAHRLRFIFHFDVGRDAMILDVPGAVRGVEGQVWCACEAVIQQVTRIRVVANQAAPRALANQRTDSVLRNIQGKASPPSRPFR